MLKALPFWVKKERTGLLEFTEAGSDGTQILDSVLAGAGVVGHFLNYSELSLNSGADFFTVGGVPDSVSKIGIGGGGDNFTKIYPAAKDAILFIDTRHMVC